MMERWLPVVGWEGVYEVSDLGSVRSVDRVVRNWPHGERVVRGRQLKPNVRGNGYAYVQLCSPGRKKRLVSIHRLVAAAFLGTPSGTFHVNHLDGEKLNNQALNLEWCTPRQNYRHARSTGLTPPPRAFGKGDDCPASKLTTEQVARIKRRIAEGESLTGIAADYPVSRSAIQEIKAGRSWGHVEEE